MILEKLTVTDFQVFQGLHTFDLTPRVKYGHQRPIILFGGLNGAGKTTTLTAVRLTLYGKQSLGTTVSNKVYEEYLIGCIHKSKNTLIQANSASTAIDFTYSSLGERKKYKVLRQWTLVGKKLVEKLQIFENGTLLEDLSNDQCQGFLNELIPVGVSELFFFDGEKIKELADDTQGTALGEAIKRLLGLDTLDTLDADLSIYIRNFNKQHSSKEVQNEISKIESQLSEIDNTISNLQCDISQKDLELNELRLNISQLERNLSERGGAFAKSREDELIKQASLKTEKQQLSKQLSDILADSYPFSVASKYSKNVIKKLRTENENISNQKSLELLTTYSQKVLHSLEGLVDPDETLELQDIFIKALPENITKINEIPIIHDKSTSDIDLIERTIQTSIKQQARAALELKKKLNDIENQLDIAGRNVARAPDESAIKPLLENINGLQKQLLEKSINREQYRIDICSKLREAIDLTRKLENLSDKVQKGDGDLRSLNYAQNSKKILKQFIKEVTKRKTMELESEFLTSYERLARKDDIHIRAKIDPKSFAVQLISQQGDTIDKSRLSAGEKQIFAISILEALARTSGRNLPIIIDTPLGRLDSKHRANLVNNYFPNASHQVIILSTDTEVDEQFYSELSSNISHAFKLHYDSESGSTIPKEGYFWKSMYEETA